MVAFGIYRGRSLADDCSVSSIVVVISQCLNLIGYDTEGDSRYLCVSVAIACIASFASL